METEVIIDQNLSVIFQRKDLEVGALAEVEKMNQGIGLEMEVSAEGEKM